MTTAVKESEVKEQEVSEEQVVEEGLNKISSLDEQISFVKRNLEQLETEKEATETLLTGMVKQKNPSPIVFKGKRFWQWVLASGKALTVYQNTRHTTKYAKALEKVKALFATQPEIITQIDGIIREETSEKHTDDLKIERV